VFAGDGAGPASVGFSRRRFTECRDGEGDVILDFLADDVDAEYPRVATLGVEWVLPPTIQPWGNRSMIFRDPAGNLVNVFSRLSGIPRITGTGSRS
jgi:catechol 2,3-dioxygenase-like lactoylglutathione lyase family enzyme